MASLASSSAPADPSAESANSAPSAARPDSLAWFRLSKPLSRLIDGNLAEVTMLGMRAFGTADLALLDQFHGKPVVMMQNVVAAMCDIDVDDVLSLELNDFTAMSEDAAWQVQMALGSMGLSPRDYLSPQANAAKP